MSEQLAQLPRYLAAHLELSLAALALGAVLCLPLGVWASRRPRAEALVLGVASVIQTIPSLALLAIMVPALALVAAATKTSLPSIGRLPALAALTLYSALPLLRNTVAGLSGVDASLREAARGLGMTPRQQLWRVELPLALPVIVAGLRTAAVWVVGMATLSTPVGAASLGHFIFSGLQTRNAAAVVVGCAASAALALLLDQWIRFAERGVRRRRRGEVALAALGLVALAAFAGAGAQPAGGTGARPVRIGSKPFTEQYVLAEIVAERVRARGFAPETVPSLGSTVLFDALAASDLDLYVDYSGTLWSSLLRETSLPDRGAVLAELERRLAREHGVVVVAPLGFENTYAIGMRRADAERRRLATLSQLARASAGLEIAGDYEFFQRAEWRALVSRYGFHFAAERAMDPTLMYAALRAGEVDAISAYSTDGRIAAYDIALLEDDRGVIPPYDAVLLASPRLAAEEPALVAALRELAGAIDAETMRALNRAVDEEGATPREAALRFHR